MTDWVLIWLEEQMPMGTSLWAGPLKKRCNVGYGAGEEPTFSTPQFFGNFSFCKCDCLGNEYIMTFIQQRQRKFLRYCWPSVDIPGLFCWFCVLIRFMRWPNTFFAPPCLSFPQWCDSTFLTITTDAIVPSGPMFLRTSALIPVSSAQKNSHQPFGNW